MDDDLRRAIAAHGASWGEYRGLAVPVHFGDPGAEWRAAREAAGVSPALRRLIAAQGEDRVAFLQGMLSNDVVALRPGRGMYAASLTQQGRVVSDLRVYLDADRVLLDVLAWQSTVLREHLERFIVADDVELDEADTQPLLIVEGPLARPIVAEALGTGGLPDDRFGHARLSFDGMAIHAAMASECDRDGVLVSGPAAAAASVFAACCEAGARPLGLQALDALRVEAGVPWSGVDMDGSVLWQEIGRDAALSFTKGCYLGQEVVERVAARGHVNRQFVGLRCTGTQMPAARQPVLADGREVGYVTSGARAAAVGRPIALAIINSKYVEPGQPVEVGTGDAALAAVVSGLPFDPAEIQ